MKSVVLLSGGMDSATAFCWAKRHTEIVAVAFFSYGQKGSHMEYSACSHLVDGEYPIRYTTISYTPAIKSSVLLKSDALILPKRDGVPDSFVPGRNLTFISIAGGLAYELGAEMIVGGWNEVDVDYPDCREEFLAAAQEAVCESLGLEFGAIILHSPVLKMDKTEIVEFGGSLGVPWQLTRSCYDSGYHPCLRCDSCEKRVTAFLKAGVRDPIVDKEVWDWLVQYYVHDPSTFDLKEAMDEASSCIDIRVYGLPDDS